MKLITELTEEVKYLTDKYSLLEIIFIKDDLGPSSKYMGLLLNIKNRIDIIYIDEDTQNIIIILL